MSLKTSKAEAGLHKELVQLLKRLRLSGFGKRRSNIGGAGGGGAEHQVLGESLAAMQTVGAGVFSHLLRGGSMSSTKALVAAGSLSSAF